MILRGWKGFLYETDMAKRMEFLKVMGLIWSTGVAVVWVAIFVVDGYSRECEGRSEIFCTTAQPEAGRWCKTTDSRHR